VWRSRAILKDPRILIFDEATSALDSKSEKLIQAELEEISRTTTLTVAHRPSTIVGADQILVLEHGRITSAGRMPNCWPPEARTPHVGAPAAAPEGADDGSPDPRNPSAQVIA
jgi:ABC-type bacteriocin/lantibiotic exporter with double-glycine peptidase domain